MEAAGVLTVPQSCYYFLEVDKIPIFESENINNKEMIDKLTMNGNIRKLVGDGDFRSSECVNYLKESDIVVTNPPFSKFTELFSLITKYNKKYLSLRQVFLLCRNAPAQYFYHISIPVLFNLYIASI